MGDDDYYDNYFDFAYDNLFGTAEEREYGVVDALVWTIFPVATIGFICSLLTLVYVALFPKPLKTTIIHCIVLCVASILTCLISLAQASTWEIKVQLKAEGKETDFIIVDYAVSWITILVIGVSHWLFVAFVTVRVIAIHQVNINRYEDYVAAELEETTRISSVRRRVSSICFVCRTVLVVLFFGWLLPTLILPFFALIEFYHNWLKEDAQVIDVLRFAFEHDFNHRWGSVIYLLLPVGISIILSVVIVCLTIIKIRGLKLMQTKWDKAKLTLGAIFIFFVTRIPMLVYVFFAFQAYPPAPKLTGDAELDAKLKAEHDVFKYKGNQRIKDDAMGTLSPICLIFACLAAVANLPLFYVSSRRFQALWAKSNADCRSACLCGRESETATFMSSSASRLSPKPAFQPDHSNGNFFFNPAHLRSVEENGNLATDLGKQ